MMHCHISFEEEDGSDSTVPVTTQRAELVKRNRKEINMLRLLGEIFPYTPITTNGLSWVIKYKCTLCSVTQQMLIQHEMSQGL